MYCASLSGFRLAFQNFASGADEGVTASDLAELLTLLDYVTSEEEAERSISEAPEDGERKYIL